MGFRPFLFSLAEKYRLNGEVSNTSEGVAVTVEGPPEAIDRFCDDIYEQCPVLASITGFQTHEVDAVGFSGFRIVESRALNGRITLISPDVAVCRECLAEMRNPMDRRFAYPFINCTHCGPRYTIIEDIPYDRPRTAMKKFPMCPACRAEYEDPRNRRFHAQPNACPECGPKVSLLDARGDRLDEDPESAIGLAARYLAQGKILAVKGLGGFHLACDGTCEKAVQKLRQRKNRPHKPFALMVASISAVEAHVHVSRDEKALLESRHRPIVLLKKKGEIDLSEVEGPVRSVAPLNPRLGVMLPYTPLHHLLLEKGPSILVMTSGNRSGDPLAIDNDEALQTFSHIADAFLVHDRDIYFRADDSIVLVQAGRSRFVRRSRGYAPLPVTVNRPWPKILACGAGLKNTICLTRGNQAFLSPHIGDLFTTAAQQYFRDAVGHLKKILAMEPEIVAHDLHPGYFSTAFATEQSNLPRVGVQHHHAHAVACMVENDLDEPVLAITLDGTGYGTDGHIWGGEILSCTRGHFERKAHLAYIPMPGGDAAVLEPWRMAAAVLHQVFGKDFIKLPIDWIRNMDRTKLAFVTQMTAKRLNSPPTSSCGRLFDAAASLLGIRHIITHEGQAAMELEAVAGNTGADRGYGFDLIQDDSDDPPGLIRIDMAPCFRDLVQDLMNREEPALISARFHETLSDSFIRAAVLVRQQTGLGKIVLSGGVFNNDRLLTRMIACLEEQGFLVYTHTRVPCGDGGISLGQAAVAAARKGDASCR